MYENEIKITSNYKHAYCFAFNLCLSASASAGCSRGDRLQLRPCRVGPADEAVH